MNLLLILLGKFLIFLSKSFNLGHGSTWPGHIALNINESFIKDLIKNSKVKIILIAGTNGKTTTGKLIHTILKKEGKKVFQNQAGANLLNGIASSLVLHSTVVGKLNYDFAVFEIDENTLPLILKEINNPNFVIILNLFRDQLDRYGEVNTIASKWGSVVQSLPSSTTLLLNVDDPQIAFLGKKTKAKIQYFGIDHKGDEQKIQHASDSTHCPNCGNKLIYKSIYFSHLGNWRCKKCGYEHPKKTFTTSPFYPLSGIYNEYNTNAAVLLSEQIGIGNQSISSALHKFKPAFGRQEILNINGKKIHIFLSKNPTSFNESLRTITELKAKNLLIVLNDRIPDGRDVSWIWDVDFENFIGKFNHITLSGDRVYDIALRLKYAEFKNFETEENLIKAINLAVEKTSKNGSLYILPTYSAMLEVRKILTGKKIL